MDPDEENFNKVEVIRGWPPSSPRIEQKERVWIGMWKLARQRRGEGTSKGTAGAEANVKTPGVGETSMPSTII